MELAGDSARDREQLFATLKKLREQRALLPEDPYLSFATDINHSEYHHDNAVIDSHDAVEQLVQAAGELDLVGFLQTAASMPALRIQWGSATGTAVQILISTGAVTSKKTRHGIRQLKVTMPVLPGSGYPGRKN